MTSNDTGDGTTVSYVNYRNYMRRARIAAKLTRTFGAVFEKTHNEFWMDHGPSEFPQNVYVHDVCFCIYDYLLVRRFTVAILLVLGRRGWMRLFRWLRPLVHHRELYKSKAMSIAKLAIASAALIVTGLTRRVFSTVFAPIDTRTSRSV